MSDYALWWDVTSSHRIRGYYSDDASSVVRFLEAVEADDPSVAAPSESEWKTFVDRSFNRGARDFAVLEGYEGIIGLLASTLLEGRDPPLRHFRIIVHPAHRRRGYGTDLLAMVESQDTKPDVVLQCNSPKTWVAGRAFLERHGFREFRGHLEMERTRGTPIPAVSVEGCTVRPYAPGDRDDAAWRRLNEVGYRGDPDFQDLTLEDLYLLREADGFSLWFADRNDEPVGLCHVEEDGKGEGRVESLVVDTPFRGRGIGRALLATGLRELGRRGIDRVTLGVVADNIAAVRLYRSMGFESREELWTWRR